MNECLYKKKENQCKSKNKKNNEEKEGGTMRGSPTSLNVVEPLTQLHSKLTHHENDWEWMRIVVLQYTSTFIN